MLPSVPLYAGVLPTTQIVLRNLQESSRLHISRNDYGETFV